jgi:hypothetical protein
VRRLVSWLCVVGWAWIWLICLSSCHSPWGWVLALSSVRSSAVGHSLGVVASVIWGFSRVLLDVQGLMYAQIEFFGGCWCPFSSSSQKRFKARALRSLLRVCSVCVGFTLRSLLGACGLSSFLLFWCLMGFLLAPMLFISLDVGASYHSNLVLPVSGDLL